MAHFMDRPEPAIGDKIIICADLPPDGTIDIKDRDDVMLRYEPTGAKSLTSSGIYLKANWMGCCRLCYREGRSNTDEIKFTQEGVWRGFADNGVAEEKTFPKENQNAMPPTNADASSMFGAEVVRKQPPPPGTPAETNAPTDHEEIDGAEEDSPNRSVQTPHSKAKKKGNK